jgi:DNA sulfur modification protein DndD
LDSDDTINAIKKLGDVSDLSEMETIVSSLKTQFQNYVSKRDWYKLEINTQSKLLQQNKKTRIDNNKLKIEAQLEIDDIDESEIEAINTQYRNFDGRYHNKHKEIVTKQLSIDNLEKQNKNNDRIITEHYKNNTKLKKYLNLKDFTDNIYKVFENIYGKLMEFVTLDLSRKATNHFQNLTWKKDFKENGVIEIDNDFNFKLMIKRKEKLQDLSAGEKQVVALSFISALTGISGFDAPIIIDSPLNRISGLHRINIAELLPKFLDKAQLLLLMTPDEFTPQVEEILGGNIHNKYDIVYDPIKSISMIEEM